MNSFDYFLDAFRKYFVFHGRSSREAFWYFTLFSILISLGLSVTDEFLNSGLFSPLYSLLALIPTIAILVRRLHDTGRSGWWALLNLIPFIGIIVLIVFCAQTSEPGENQYGKNPLEQIDKENIV